MTASTRETLAQVYQILARWGLDDLIYSHVTSNVNGEILVAPYGMLFNEVTADCLIPITNSQANPTAVKIHQAIHSARPDVTTIIHTHTIDGGAVAADQRGLLPISQQAALIYNQLAYHDYQGLILTDTEAEQLVTDIEDKNCVILKNHGFLALGTTPAEALWRVYHMEEAAKIQCRANLGFVELISERTVKRMPAQARMMNKTHLDPYELFWQAACRQLK